MTVGLDLGLDGVEEQQHNYHHLINAACVASSHKYRLIVGQDGRIQNQKNGSAFGGAPKQRSPCTGARTRASSCEHPVAKVVSALIRG
jgi:hypothetical protein